MFETATTLSLFESNHDFSIVVISLFGLSLQNLGLKELNLIHQRHVLPTNTSGDTKYSWQWQYYSNVASHICTNYNLKM